MIIAVTLAVLIFAFFFLRRSSGAALLAAVAGLAVYEMFGLGLAAQIHEWIPGWELWLIKNGVYAALVLVFPLLLYFRSGRGGLNGLLRLGHSAVLAIFLTALMAGPLAEIFSFDDLARDITGWIDSAKGGIVAAGLIGAYIDILFMSSRE